LGGVLGLIRNLVKLLVILLQLGLEDFGAWKSATSKVEGLGEDVIMGIMRAQDCLSLGTCLISS
jgi:hypothetical protein